MISTFSPDIAWLTEAFDEVHLDTHELTASDDKVFVHQTNSGRGKMSGVEASWELWLLWTLREGKIVRGQAFTVQLNQPSIAFLLGSRTGGPAATRAGRCPLRSRAATSRVRARCLYQPSLPGSPLIGPWISAVTQPP